MVFHTISPYAFKSGGKPHQTNRAARGKGRGNPPTVSTAILSEYSGYGKQFFIRQSGLRQRCQQQSEKSPFARAAFL
jgi:hypothetical protein